MERRILDQTASERLLHRVLYAIKFLRAMVLHVSLAALAAIVFATTGVIGLYPVADNTIRVLRASAIEQELQHGSFGGAGVWVATALVIAAAIAALVWIYRSITDVRPKSLRVQAVAIVAVALWDVAALRDELQFAFANLDPTSAVIAALGVGLSLFVFPVNIAVSLWQVSRAPERSSSDRHPRSEAGTGSLDVLEQAARPAAHAASDRQDPGRVCACGRRRAVAGRVDDVPAPPWAARAAAWARCRSPAMPRTCRSAAPCRRPGPRQIPLALLLAGGRRQRARRCCSRWPSGSAG